MRPRLSNDNICVYISMKKLWTADLIYSHIYWTSFWVQEHSPLHWQRAVQFRRSLLHVHLPSQSVRHPHFFNPVQTDAASGSNDHTGCQTPESSWRHPYSDGEGSVGIGSVDWFQMYPAWKIVLLICWRRAPFVGGIFSISLSFLVKSCNRALLTVTRLLVLSYRRTT